jgi:hypothetical protein
MCRRWRRGLRRMAGRRPMRDSGTGRRRRRIRRLRAWPRLLAEWIHEWASRWLGRRVRRPASPGNVTERRGRRTRRLRRLRWPWRLRRYVRLGARRRLIPPASLIHRPRPRRIRRRIRPPANPGNVPRRRCQRSRRPGRLRRYVRLGARRRLIPPASLVHRPRPGRIRRRIRPPANAGNIPRRPRERRGWRLRREIARLPSRRARLIPPAGLIHRPRPRRIRRRIGPPASSGNIPRRRRERWGLSSARVKRRRRERRGVHDRLLRWIGCRRGCKRKRVGLRKRCVLGHVLPRGCYRTTAAACITSRPDA